MVKNDLMIKNTIMYIPSVILPAMINFAYMAIMIRMVGASVIGEYFLLIAVVNLVSTILGGWYQQSILRFESGIKSDGIDKVINLRLLYFTLLSLFAISGIIIELICKRYITTNSLVIICIYIEVVYKIMLSIIQSAGNAKIYSAGVFASNLIKLLLGIVFVIIFGKIVNVLLIVYIISIALVIIYYRRYLFNSLSIRMKYLLGCISKGTWLLFLSYLRYGFPVMLVLIISSFKIFFDRKIIGILLNMEHVGVYTSYYSVGTNIIGSIINPIMLSSHPIIMASVNADENSVHDFKIMINEYLNIYISSAFVITLLILPNRFLISDILIGPNYSKSSIALIYIIIGTLINGISMFSIKGFEINKRTELITITNLAAFIVGSLATYIGIIAIGFNGAGIGVLIGSVVYLLLNMILGNRYLKIKLPKREMMTGFIFLFIEIFNLLYIDNKLILLFVSLVITIMFIVILMFSSNNSKIVTLRKKVFERIK